MSEAMVRLVDESRLSAAGRRFARTVLAERELIIRSDGRVRYVNLNRIAQVVIGSLFIAALGWSGFASLSYVQLTREAVEKDRHIALSNRVNSELRVDMDDSRRRFLEITQTLEKNHGHLVALVGDDRTRNGNLVSLQRKLRNADALRQATQARSQGLRQQLSSLEQRVQETVSRNLALADDLRSAENELNASLSSQTEAGERGAGLADRVLKLSGRLDTVQSSQSALLKRLTRAASGDIDRVRELIAKTGLSVEDLLADDDLPVMKKIATASLGQGGPFLPAQPAVAPIGFVRGLDAFNAEMDRWQEVQHLLGRLPLIAPVSRFRITSRFGNRRDPINGHTAYHSGLDIAAPIHGKVRATAPGRVVRAGWRGRYGRLVEIDHGMGIRTRYGHLAKILVKRGQQITFRHPIGLLGNSGRSTGPHLHYEVVVDGKPVDPRKFLRAGKHVFEG